MMDDSWNRKEQLMFIAVEAATIGNLDILLFLQTKMYDFSHIIIGNTLFSSPCLSFLYPPLLFSSLLLYPLFSPPLLSFSSPTY